MALSRRSFLSGATACGCSATLAACAVNPATGRNTFTGLAGGMDNDIALGQREHPKLLQSFGGAYEHPRLQSYVDRIGKRVAALTEQPNLPYTFTIANSQVVNAFALPGGPVTITRGLLALCDSEAELASVLGHEIAHVTARHSAERQSQGLLAQLGLTALAVATGSSDLANLVGMGAGAYLQSYSRDQESEADRLGARYMEKAGYDVDAMVTFLDSLYGQSRLEARMMGLPEGKVDEFNMMATHPRTKDRVQQAIQIAAVSNQQNAIVNREVYLNEVNGMLFGDDPEQGITYGRRFAHPELRFEFTVPEGFRIINDPAKVLALNPQGDAIVFDMARHGALDMTSYITRQWARGARLDQVEAITVNGLPAATAVTRGKINNKMSDIRLVAIRKDGNEVYRFMLVTAPARTRQMDAAMKQATYSFKRLTPAEAARVKPLELIVTFARPAETVSSLSREMPFDQFNEDWFRLLNNMDPTEVLKDRQLIKMIRKLRQG